MITNTLTKTLFIFCFLFAYQSADAQIWKNMGGKVKDKLERQADKRLEQKIDKTIDKGFDKAEQGTEDAVKGNKNKSGKPQSSPESTGEDDMPFDLNSILSGSGGMDLGNLENVMNAMNADVKLPSTYNFNLGISYSTSFTEDGKKKDINNAMTIWYSPKDYAGISTDMDVSTFMVMDQGYMISFMEKEKTYTAINPEAFAGMLGTAVSDDDDDDGSIPDIKKIGSEKILGYNCTIYEVKDKDDEGTAKIWLTNELQAEGASYIKAMSGFAGKMGGKINTKGLSKIHSDIIYGTMMKIETHDEEGISVIQAEEVIKSGKTIDTKQYKKLGLGY